MPTAQHEKLSKKLSKLRIGVVPCIFFYNFLSQFFYNFERSDHYQAMTELSHRLKHFVNFSKILLPDELLLRYLQIKTRTCLWK